MSSPATALVETGGTPVKQAGCSLLVKIIIGVTVSAVVVAGAASAGYFLTVDTDTNDIKGIDPLNLSTTDPFSGQTTADGTEQPASEQTTTVATVDHTSQTSNGQNTGSNIGEQSTGAGVSGQTTGGGLSGQTTGGGVSGQTTGGGVPGQTSGASFPGQTTGAGVPGQTTGASVPRQTTGGGVPGQTSVASLQGQTTGAGVPVQTTGAGVPGQSDGAGVSGQTTGASLPGQTTGGGLTRQNISVDLPAQTTGANIVRQTTSQVITGANTGLTSLPSSVTLSQTSGQMGQGSTSFNVNAPSTPGNDSGVTSAAGASITIPLMTAPTPATCPDGYIRTVIFSQYSGTSNKLWLRGADVPLVHLPSGNSEYDRFARGDTKLDWVGREDGQDAQALGTPTLKTTSELTSPEYHPLNTFGLNHWITHVCLDCSGTGNNRFQFKMFTNDWEQVNGDDTNCFKSNNHYAECGKINVFNYGSTGCQINDFQTQIA